MREIVSPLDGFPSWSTGTPVSVAAPADPPVADSISVGAQTAEGNVPVAYANLSEDAPESFFVFTSSATLPTRAQVIAGQDHEGNPAAEAGTVNLPQAAGTVTVSGLVLPSGTWHLHLVLGDAAGDRGDPVYAGSTVLDFTAPVPSGLTGTQTGATTATAAVTSDEAGGTIFFGIRPSAAAALTAAQLVAGSGGAGVAWASDTTPTADGNNAASFTGLTASTAYRVDAVHRDSKGNVSAVVSSDEFTTAADASSFMTFLAQRIDTGNFGTTHTFNNAWNSAIPADLEGRKFAMVINVRQNTTVSGVTMGGTAATLRASSTADQKVYVYDCVAGAANDDIVVTLSASQFCEVTIYETDANFVDDVTVTNNGAAAPRVWNLSANTQAGDFVVGGLGGFSRIGGVFQTLTNADYSFVGLTQRGNVSNRSTRAHLHFDNLAASGGTPETFTVTCTLGDDVAGDAALAIYR